MGFIRKFKVVYRSKVDTITLPINKAQQESEIVASNVDEARAVFKEANPNAWIVTIVPI